MQLIVILLLGLIIEPVSARAPEERIFNQNVHKVILKIHRETETQVLTGDKRLGRIYEFCFYQETQNDQPEVCLPNAGYRVRGNTSQFRQKRQFKIKFNLDEKDKVFERNGQAWSAANEPKRKFMGFSAINLRSGGIGTNDDSMTREMLAGRIFNEFSPSHIRDGMAYRSAHAKLFVQYCDLGSCGPADYKGLYMLAEDVDKVFVENRFGEDAPGVLISTAYASATARADFGLTRFHTDSFEVKSDKLSRDQWSAVERGFANESSQCNAQFVRSRGYKRDEEQAARLMCATLARLSSIISRRDLNELRQLFDLPSSYAYMAAANFTGHWDSLIGNANNDYLFFNPALGGGFGGKWQILVWDLDNSIGQSAGEQINAGHLKFSIHTKNKLFEFILDEPRLREEFEGTYRQLIRRMDRGDMIASLDRIEGRVKDSVRGTWEENVGIDYSAAFKYLKDFVNTRYEAVKNSLNR